jgi:hypothetical protein
VVHVLWLLVEWPVRLPFEAGLLLCGRRITPNMSSHDDHVHIIYGLSSEICFICFCTLENCEWAVYQTVLRFLTTVYINWGEVTLYERGLLRAGVLSHGSCHIKRLLLLLFFGKPCTRNFSGVSIDVKCSHIPSISSSNVFETNYMFSPVGQCLFTTD